ncbi:hypothetical protein L1049_010427 [Liquidambar formosana]|uniref:Uncharacterized protein n=1 Tax=Liquidambar formosana TaxID=63359 RepID=A0AAP0R4E0_LIQFO
MAFRSRVSIFVPVLLIIVLASLYRSSHGGDVRVDSAGRSIRNLSAMQRNNQIPSCSEMVSKSQCARNSKCRWCSSRDLDDMCFTKSEAWRLPDLVFSCD